MKRLLPSPVLSVALFLLWLLLNEPITLGSALLGAVVALLAPPLTAPLRPGQVRVRRPLVALRLLGSVVLDMFVSNLQVARGALGGRVHSGFISVPLALRDPNGLAVLSVIMAAVPGTVWCELAPDGSALRLHLFDLQDEAKAIALIRDRYEKPLMEIFE